VILPEASRKVVLPEEFVVELPVVLPDGSRYVVLPEELVVALPVVRPEESRYVVLDWAEAMLTDDTAKVIAAHTVKTVFIFHSPLFLVISERLILTENNSVV
jgi:hypothetical protein